MTCRAALLTPLGLGGIAAVQLFGPDSRSVIEKIFRSQNPSASSFRDHDLLLGTIEDDAETIDQVIVTVDSRNQTVDINCHGGPRIVQRLLMLLQKQNVQIVTWDQLIPAESIEQEIAVTLPRAQTRTAALAIAAQNPGGLHRWLTEAIKSLQNDTFDISCLRSEIEKLLATYPLAQKLLHPSTVVLTGPVNVGKSTLANALTGRTQSIIADLPGTTRDWTTQLTGIRGLPVNLIDTAGRRFSTDLLEKQSHVQADEQISRADLILLIVTANGRESEQVKQQLPFLPPQAKPLLVVNKVDLSLSSDLTLDAVSVSALTGHNLDQLRLAIVRRLGFSSFKTTNPLVFTPRQIKLLRDALNAPTNQDMISYLNEIIYTHRV